MYIYICILTFSQEYLLRFPSQMRWINLVKKKILKIYLGCVCSTDFFFTCAEALNTNVTCTALGFSASAALLPALSLSLPFFILSLLKESTMKILS